MRSVSTSRGWLRPVWPCLACWLLWVVAGAFADDPAKKKEPLPPEEIETVTKEDGVTIKATWYPSQAGRQAAVVILLHGYQGRRVDFHQFALFLQREKDFAVIVPDLRGHGDSLTRVDAEGERHELRPDRLTHEDFEAMSFQDVEAIKRFLVKRNNAGELNIERLGMVGAEMGALVAVQWAYEDWEYDQLPLIKQGRDVKALTLLSPNVRFKNLNANWLIEEPLRGKIALQIVAGNGAPRALKNARQVYHLVEHLYLRPDNIERQKLFLDVGYATSLQGTKMFGEKLGLEDRIARFFEIELVEPEFEWKERKSPL